MHAAHQPHTRRPAHTAHLACCSDGGQATAGLCRDLVWRHDPQFQQALEEAVAGADIARWMREEIVSGAPGGWDGWPARGGAAVGCARPACSTDQPRPLRPPMATPPTHAVQAAREYRFEYEAALASHHMAVTEQNRRAMRLDADMADAEGLGALDDDLGDDDEYGALLPGWGGGPPRVAGLVRWWMVDGACRCSQAPACSHRDTSALLYCTRCRQEGQGAQARAVRLPAGRRLWRRLHGRRRDGCAACAAGGPRRLGRRLVGCRTSSALLTLPTHIACRVGRRRRAAATPRGRRQRGGPAVHRGHVPAAQAAARAVQVSAAGAAGGPCGGTAGLRWHCRRVESWQCPSPTHLSYPIHLSSLAGTWMSTMRWAWTRGGTARARTGRWPRAPEPRAPRCAPAPAALGWGRGRRGWYWELHTAVLDLQATC